MVLLNIFQEIVRYIDEYDADQLRLRNEMDKISTRLVNLEKGELATAKKEAEKMGKELSGRHTINSYSTEQDGFFGRGSEAFEIGEKVKIFMYYKKGTEEVNQVEDIEIVFSPYKEYEKLEEIHYKLSKTFKECKVEEEIILFQATLNFSQDGVISNLEIEQNTDKPSQKCGSFYYRPSKEKVKSNTYTRT